MSNNGILRLQSDGTYRGEFFSLKQSLHVVEADRLPAVDYGDRGRAALADKAPS
jgi:hypothetical protein